MMNYFKSYHEYRQFIKAKRNFKEPERVAVVEKKAEPVKKTRRKKKEAKDEVQA